MTLHTNKRGNTPKEITIINLYALNFIKHTLKDLKAYIDSNTKVVGDFNPPITNREILD
jgi:hypothetical protein